MSRAKYSYPSQKPQRNRGIAAIILKLGRSISFTKEIVFPSVTVEYEVGVPVHVWAALGTETNSFP